MNEVRRGPLTRDEYDTARGYGFYDQLEDAYFTLAIRLAEVEQERDAFAAQSKCMYCRSHHFNVSVCAKCTFSKPAAEPFKLSQLRQQMARLREASTRLLAVRGQACDGVAVWAAEWDTLEQALRETGA